MPDLFEVRVKQAAETAHQKKSTSVVISISRKDLRAWRGRTLHGINSEIRSHGGYNIHWAKPGSNDKSYKFGWCTPASKAKDSGLECDHSNCKISDDVSLVPTYKQYPWMQLTGIDPGEEEMTMNTANIEKMLDYAMETQTADVDGERNTVCLMGPPGIGKTHRVRRWANKHNLFLDTIILSRIPSVDIGGVYAPDFEKGELKHMITTRLVGGNVPDGYDGVVIFFDELGSAAEDQQVAVQDIIESGVLEGNKIGKNTIFVAASNRVEDNCGVHEMVQSLRDRLLFIELTVDTQEWIEWSVLNEVDPRITAYIMFNNEALHKFNPSSEEYSHPNPRSWTKTSAMIKKDLDGKMLQTIATAKVGEAYGREFAGFCKLDGTLPTLNEIYADPENAIVPIDSAQSCYAVVSRLAWDFGKMNKAKEKKEQLNKRKAEAAIIYLKRFNDVYAVFGFQLCSKANRDFSGMTSLYSQFVVDHQEMDI